MPPKVSVIIPAYNPQAYLDVTIQSALAQTYANFEIIIVDDGSTEDLSRFTNFDPKVLLIRQEHSGVSAARNLGIARSSGELIAFLDGDDIWLPTKLEQQARLFELPEIALAYTAFTLIDGDGKPLGAGWSDDTNSYKELLHGCSLCTSSVVIRRSVLDQVGIFDPLYLAAEDFDLWLRIAQRHEVRCLDAPLVLYRTHDNNSALQYVRTASATINILMKHLSYAYSAGDTAAVSAAKTGIRRTRNTFAYQAFDRCRKHFRRKEILGFTQHLWNTITLSRSTTIPIRSVFQHQVLAQLSRMLSGKRIRQ